MEAVVVMGAADLVPPAGLLGSVALHDEQAVAQQPGPPLCLDDCTSLPQLLFITKDQIVKSLLTVQKTL